MQKVAVVFVGMALIFILSSCNLLNPQPLKANLIADANNGWRDLFEKDLSNCLYKPASWVFEDEMLSLKGGGYIWTKEQYGDFILELEFKIPPKGNSGIFFRTTDINDPVQTGIEIQVSDSYGRELRRGSCGAVYDCMAPSKNMAKKAEQWNHVILTCKDNKIYVVMNGRQIIDMDLNLWTQPHKNPDGTKNKFSTAYKDMPRKGHIGFQDHGKPVWYRNMSIKSLDN